MEMEIEEEDGVPPVFTGHAVMGSASEDNSCTKVCSHTRH